MAATTNSYQLIFVENIERICRSHPFYASDFHTTVASKTKFGWARERRFRLLPRSFPPWPSFAPKRSLFFPAFAFFCSTNQRQSELHIWASLPYQKEESRDKKTIGTLKNLLSTSDFGFGGSGKSIYIRGWGGYAPIFRVLISCKSIVTSIHASPGGLNEGKSPHIGHPSPQYEGLRRERERQS